jgi:hypothetical protein
MKTRYAPLFIGLLLGLAAGLFYGWKIHPVRAAVTTPSSLQEEYRTDIVLMIAETYAEERDLELARQRLNLLGFHSHEDTVLAAIHFANTHDLSDQDIIQLTHLLHDLQEGEATPEISGP